MSITNTGRKVHMNALQYMELLRARDEQRRVDVMVLFTPTAAHVLRVRVH